MGLKRVLFAALCALLVIAPLGILAAPTCVVPRALAEEVAPPPEPGVESSWPPDEPVTNPLDEGKVRAAAQAFVEAYYTLTKDDYPTYYSRLAELVTPEQLRQVEQGTPGLAHGFVKSDIAEYLVQDGYFARNPRIVSLTIEQNTGGNAAIEVTVDFEEAASLEGESWGEAAVPMRERLFLSMNDAYVMNIVSWVEEAVPAGEAGFQGDAEPAQGASGDAATGVPYELPSVEETMRRARSQFTSFGLLGFLGFLLVSTLMVVGQPTMLRASDFAGPQTVGRRVWRSVRAFLMRVVQGIIGLPPRLSSSVNSMAITLGLFVGAYGWLVKLGVMNGFVGLLLMIAGAVPLALVVPTVVRASTLGWAGAARTLVGGLAGVLGALGGLAIMITVPATRGPVAFLGLAAWLIALAFCVLLVAVNLFGVRQPLGAFAVVFVAWIFGISRLGAWAMNYGTGSMSDFYTLPVLMDSLAFGFAVAAGSTGGALLAGVFGRRAPRRAKTKPKAAIAMRRRLLESPREIRVFVSSTFRDMIAERDRLTKRAFPAIRQLASERLASFTDVDLRWGITDEQKADNQVLPICLAEIERCRPYFIGILGERYGWVPGPDDVAQDLKAAQPWLEDDEGRSVTEIEMVHGVLRNPEMAGRALFYFRDPAYVGSLPAEAAEALREGVAQDDIDRWGSERARQLKDERVARLARLKDVIRHSGFPVREYRDPDGLAALVEEDLRRIVDEEYPATKVPDATQIGWFGHESFALSRRTVFVDDAGRVDALDAMASAQGAICAISGPAGSGKSALLANWANTVTGRRPGTIVVEHYVSADDRATRGPDMCRRIVDELALAHRKRLVLPKQDEFVYEAFAGALSHFATLGPFVVVVDGVDQMQDVYESLELGWLPESLPDNAHVVFSTRPGTSLEVARRRGLPILNDEGLRPEERERFVREYLALYGKAISSDLASELRDSDACANPMFLKTLLDELRVGAAHETPRSDVASFLADRDLVDLSTRLLERWERDFDPARHGLVGDTLGLLWASRDGLLETVLRELLGGQGGPLPQAVLSPLLLALDPFITRRVGRLAIASPDLRQAVESRYLDDAQARQSAHARLAALFMTGYRAGSPDARELPWQLMRSESWDALYVVLSDLSLASTIQADDGAALAWYWTALKKNRDVRVADAYATVIADKQADPDARIALGTLLWQADEIVAARQTLKNEATTSLKHLDVLHWLQAMHLLSMLPTAEAGSGETERAPLAAGAYERLANMPGAGTLRAPAVMNRGNSYLDAGDPASATAAFQEALGLARESGDADMEVQALIGLARCAMDVDDWQAAKSITDMAGDAAKRSGSDDLIGSVDEIAAAVDSVLALESEE